MSTATVNNGLFYDCIIYGCVYMSVATAMSLNMDLDELVRTTCHTCFQPHPSIRAWRCWFRKECGNLFEVQQAKNKAATTKKCETKSNTSEVSTHPHDRQEAEDSSGPILHAKLFMCRAVACNKGMQCRRARWSADKMRRVCDLNAR